MKFDENFLKDEKCCKSLRSFSNIYIGFATQDVLNFQKLHKSSQEIHCISNEAHYGTGNVIFLNIYLQFKNLWKYLKGC